MLRRRHRVLPALVLSLALLAAACGDSDADADADDASASAESDSTADAGRGDAATDDTEASTPDDDEQLSSDGEGSDPATLEPVAGGEIDWAFSDDGTGFDTTGSIAPGSIRLLSTLNDPLVVIDTNSDWQPNLAESVVPNDDFTSWTITMRPGLTFHDGEPIDGEAVRANLQAIKDSPAVGFALAPVESISVVDELSARVDLFVPWAAFPHILANQPGWLVSPSTIGTNETFVGTGPFMLESWIPNDSARVVRNPNYWRADEGLPYLDAINIKFLSEATVRRQAFEAGDVRGYHFPGDEGIVEYLEDDDVDVWISTGGANEYMWVLNTAVPPFDDVRVRRAMAHAIDQQFLVDTFRSGLTVPADGPISPSEKWYSPSGYPEFDPDAARALVDEYEAEVGPIEFELSISLNPAVVEVAEVMLSFLSDVGIDGSLREIGPGQAIVTLISDDFQAASWFQFAAPDPDDLYIFFHSSAGALNWSNLVDEDIDAGLDVGRASDDEATRGEGYRQFLEALGSAVPIIWVDHLGGVEAVAVIPEIHGIGVPGTLRDGGEIMPMTHGTRMLWNEIWLEQ
ncbi:MAG: ABC transporter substrate-binding protein [Actinomycetota bacterium]